MAKAKVLVTEKAPAYQWVITEVYNNDVTFTNRETEESFTAKLFPVEGQADTYELAVNRVNADNGAAEASEVSNTNVAPIYVDQNTYNEKQGSISAKLDKLVIELKPVEVDPYAGFLNVDDKTLVTMAFARDNNETSNKWNDKHVPLNSHKVWFRILLLVIIIPSYRLLTFHLFPPGCGRKQGSCDNNIFHKICPLS